MNKKSMMGDFIKLIYDKELMTKFIINIFGYTDFFDYNYMFRYMDKDNSIIIDIYDNVTNSRFNRYIFNFSKCDYIYKKEIVDNLNIHYISVLNTEEDDNNLIKLAYLFKINNDMMILYADTFLDKDFVLILKDIIK